MFNFLWCKREMRYVIFAGKLKEIPCFKKSYTRGCCRVFRDYTTKRFKMRTWGFQRGQCPIWYTTLLAKCSVLYALSALLRKWGCHRKRQALLKQQENRALFEAGKPETKGWFHQQTGRIWKPLSFVPRRTSGQFVPNLWPHSFKNWNGWEAILELSRLDYQSVKPGETVNGGAVSDVHLDRWLVRPGLLSFLFTHSPKIAPPNIITAPMICTGSIISFKSKTENNTAESGSKYPQIATVCTGRFPIEEK